MKTIHRTWTELLVGLALVALTLAVFWPATACKFVSYDDDDYVTANPHVQQGLTTESMRWAFTTGHAANWHPLTWLSLMLDHNLFHLDPWGYHATNVLLHAVNVGLVFLVLNRMTGALGRSALVAALFAVHPLRVESVVWVSERKDVLCAFFGLLAIAAYTRYARSPSPLRYGLVLVMYALSLMAKPMLVTLPCLLLLLDYWPLARLRIDGARHAPRANIRGAHDTPLFSQRSAWRLVYEKLPLFALAVVSSIVTLLVQSHGKAVQSWEDFAWDYRLANAAVSYVRYLGKMFRFDSLAVIYPHPGAWPEWQAILCATFIVVSVAAVLSRIRSKPWLAVGWFWYLGLLIPVIGLVQVGLQAMADRYTYLPSIGVLILLVWSLPAWLFRSVPGRWLLGFATVGCLAVLCHFTRVQIRTWHDSATLFEHALRVTPDNYLAHDELGVLLANSGHAREALEQFRFAAKIRPTNALIYFNQGNAHLALGEFEPALGEFAKAIELKSDFAEAFNGHGLANHDLGRDEDAVADFSRAIELRPDFADAYNGRGVARSQLKQLPEAVSDFTEAIRLKPDFVAAYVNRGTVYTAQQRPRNAIEDFDHAIALAPDYAQAFEYRGNAYHSLHQLNKAIADFSHAIELKPDDASAFGSRAVAYYHQQQYEAAWSDVQVCRALGGQIDPNFITILSKASGRAD